MQRRSRLSLPVFRFPLQNGVCFTRENGEFAGVSQSRGTTGSLGMAVGAGFTARDRLANGCSSGTGPANPNQQSTGSSQTVWQC